MHGNMVFFTHYMFATPQQSGGFHILFHVCSVNLNLTRMKRREVSTTTVTNLGCVGGQYHTNNEQTQSDEYII